MPLVPLELPPGVYRNGTDLQSAGRWLDASLVRWHEGTIKPIGGWVARTASTANAAPRGALAWKDNSGDRWVGIGTYNKLYALSASGTLSDITPAGLTAGVVNATTNTGYGGGFYGAGFYGTVRLEAASVTPATTWALDTWGEYLIACSDADGTIYEWQLNTGTPAAAVTNAPTSNISAMVTEERFLMALGAGGDARKVQWSDREVNTTWTAASTNEAGDFTLVTGGEIMCGLRVRGQSLILTSTDAHTATYVGPPFVYGFERVGSACGVISKRGAVSSNGIAYWMGKSGFYRYNGGGVEEIPCDVSDYVFGAINNSNNSKVYATTNSAFNEIWWFYPQSTECDSYVVYNYAEGHWSIGTIDRTCGADTGVFQSPIWCDSSGAIYDQETGVNWDSASVYAESGPLTLNPDGVVSITDLIPDEKTQGQVTITFKTRFYPNASESSHGPYTLSNPTSVRFSGRQVRLRVDGDANASWRFGIPRVDTKSMGRR